jgi:hypothetical protein
MQCYVELLADEVTDPQVKAAYAYWLKARGDKPMPPRNVIDPIDLKFCLGWACLINVVHEPSRRFKYRVGEPPSPRNWLGSHRPLPGRHEGQGMHFVLTIYNRVVDGKAPVFIRNSEE